MAQFQIVTADEPTMFAAAQVLGLIPAGQPYVAGAVEALTGGVISGAAWAANIYGSSPLGAGWYGILTLPDAYTLPGDTQTLASRVYAIDPTTGATTATPYVFAGVTIGPIPDNSPVVFS